MSKARSVKQKYNFGWLKDFEKLFFPQVCIACARSLNAREEAICINCLIKLPRTNYHRLNNNPVSKKFAGRIPIEMASSFLYFSKGNSARQLLHHLKYKGRQDIGKRLGALYGKDLMNDGFVPPDLIIPLPLHPAKERIRGYNQCTSIVEGLNKYLGSEVSLKAITRISNNTTQTKKGRYERWENVERIFEVKEPQKIQNKSVLLVDDVVTTGATLEACGRVLLNHGASKLIFLTLATA